jgi:hypothetical protein
MCGQAVIDEKKYVPRHIYGTEGRCEMCEGLALFAWRHEPSGPPPTHEFDMTWGPSTSELEAIIALD